MKPHSKCLSSQEWAQKKWFEKKVSVVEIEDPLYLQFITTSCMKEWFHTRLQQRPGETRKTPSCSLIKHRAAGTPYVHSNIFKAVLCEVVPGTMGSIICSSGKRKHMIFCVLCCLSQNGKLLSHLWCLTRTGDVLQDPQAEHKFNYCLFALRLHQQKQNASSHQISPTKWLVFRSGTNMSGSEQAVSLFMPNWQASCFLSWLFFFIIILSYFLQRII